MTRIQTLPARAAFALALVLLPFGSARAADRECKTGPKLVARVDRDAGASATCLDSEVAAGRVRALVLVAKETETSNGGREETNVAVVVEGTLAPGGKEVATIDSQIRLEDASLFPNGCGEYLMGGRLLPGKRKIALVYPHKVRGVDYANPAKPVVSVLHDDTVPGMASTCEGYVPNWDGGREGIAIDGKKGTLTVTVTSRTPIEKVELKKFGRPEHRKFYTKAYALQCEGGSPEKNSKECKDLKRARDEGVFPLRKKVYPDRHIMTKY